jgi:hypothetical protein
LEIIDKGLVKVAPKTWAFLLKGVITKRLDQDSPRLAPRRLNTHGLFFVRSNKNGRDLTVIGS